MKPNVYLAAPLFNPQERSFNELLAEILSATFTVFLPQRDGVLIPGAFLDKDGFETLAREAYVSDTRAIEKADVLVAVLDGRTIDEGVAFELGYAVALGKECVGIKTDSRVLLPHGINPMILCSVSRIIGSAKEVAEWVETRSPATSGAR